MLLINPTHTRRAHNSPSLGLAYIAAVAESKGRKVEILDCQITKNYLDAICRALPSHRTAGVHINVGTISCGLEITRLIRKHAPETKIIMGGPHAGIVYSELIPQYADIVVIGEGELAIGEILEDKPLNEISGIAYWQDGLRTTTRRKMNDDLDDLPLPAWHLFDLFRYKHPGHKTPVGYITTSRGCPYSCIYCTSFVHGKKIRIRSIDSVMKELDQLIYHHQVKEIMISDNNFTFYPERVKRICKAIIARQYKGVRFNLVNGIRADIYDMEMFMLFQKAGFCYTRLGLESGNQEVLDKIKKKLNITKVQRTVRALKSVGMRVDGVFILGLPYDTVETMQETIDFAIELPLDRALFAIAQPYPGTELFEIVKREGRLLQEDMFMTTISGLHVYYEINDLKRTDVETMLFKAFSQYYLRLNQFLKMSKTLEGFSFFLIALIIMYSIKSNTRKKY